jgi:hypothetical protein
MSLTPTTPNFDNIAQSAKDFWNRPEGKYGKGAIVVAAAAVGALVFFNMAVIAAFVRSALSTLIGCIEIGAIVAVVTSPIWSPSVRGLLRNTFQLIIRGAYKALIAKDPIGMLDNNIDNMKEELTKFDGGVSQLAGSKQRLETDIDSQKTQIKNYHDLSDASIAKLAKLKLQVSTLTGNPRQEMLLLIQQVQLGQQGYLSNAGICVQSIKTEQPILDQTNRMYDQMCRLRNLAEFKVASLKQQRDMYSKQRDTILASQKALGAAGRIIKGDPKQLAIVEMTIEMLNNETADTIGAMKDFNRNSEKYLTDMDIQNDANAAGAQKVFDALEQKLALPNPVTGEAPPVELIKQADGVYAQSPGTLTLSTSSSDDDWTKLLK